MGWILLFAISLALIFGFLAVIFTVSKESDEQAGESGLSKNQIRAIAWTVGVIICIAAALIEYVIVIRGSDEEDNSSIQMSSEEVVASVEVEGLRFD